MTKPKELDTRHSVALWLAQLAADVANYCDHAEHNEPVERAWVTNAASELRMTALKLAELDQINLIEAYAARLRTIEQRNVLHSPSSFDGAHAVKMARTWRELQVAQIEHDKAYHPDVIGLHKQEQLRHYALHLSKIAGAFARRAISDRVHVEIVDRRLPDLLIFALKLSTVMGERLSEDDVRANRSTPGQTQEIKQKTLASTDHPD
jgi:hypothetical protein